MQQWASYKKRRAVDISGYYPKTLRSHRHIKVEANVSNYTTKAGVKKALGVKIILLAKKVDVADMKSDVVKLDIDEFKTIPND